MFLVLCSLNPPNTSPSLIDLSLTLLTMLSTGLLLNHLQIPTLNTHHLFPDETPNNILNPKFSNPWDFLFYANAFTTQSTKAWPLMHISFQITKDGQQTSNYGPQAPTFSSLKRGHNLIIASPLTSLPQNTQCIIDGTNTTNLSPSATGDSSPLKLSLVTS